MGCDKLPSPTNQPPRASDKLNVVQTVPNACAPAGSVSDSIHKFIPNNQEYQWAGEGSGCNYCSFDAPREVSCSSGCADAGCCSIWGKRGTYKRVAYKGSATDCCWSQPANQMVESEACTPYGWCTCNPIYVNNYASADCDATMLARCNAGGWGTHDQCRVWAVAAVNNGRDIANPDLGSWCAQQTNFTTKICQDWCNAVKQPNSASPSACDDAITTYCKNNPQDPNCGCINPPENIKKIAPIMQSSIMCWYSPCNQTTGAGYNYLTSNMVTTLNNCKSVVCNIDVGDVTISGANNEVNFTNDCMLNSVKPEYIKDGEVFLEPQQPGPGPGPSRNTVIGAVSISSVLLLLLLSCIILAVVYINA